MSTHAKSHVEKAVARLNALSEAAIMRLSPTAWARVVGYYNDDEDLAKRAIGLLAEDMRHPFTVTNQGGGVGYC